MDDEELVPENKLRDTGNEATVTYEEALLQEYFGEADGDGVYGGRK